MAIIKNLGLSVTIQVNGTPLDEYDDNNPNHLSEADKKCRHVCPKYVEAKEGDLYAICVKVLPKNRWLTADSPDDRRLSVHGFIDGLCQHHRSSDWKHLQTQTGTLISGTNEYHNSYQRSLRKFCFAGPRLPLSSVNLTRHSISQEMSKENPRQKRREWVLVDLTED